MVDVAVEAPALDRGGDVAGAVRLGPGGSAANVAAWAAVAGGRVRLVAGRGDDLAGRLLAAALEERGIELYPVGPVAGPSGAMLVVMEAGERSFVADPGANLGLGEGTVVAGLGGAGAVFVSGYPLLRPATRAAAMAAADGGRAGRGPGGGRRRLLAAARRRRGRAGAGRGRPGRDPAGQPGRGGRPGRPARPGGGRGLAGRAGRDGGGEVRRRRGGGL